MNGFLRQVAALGALWALCELLLPEGSLHKTVRLTVSLVVMAVLLVSMVDLVQGWTRAGGQGWTEALSVVAEQSSQQAAAATPKAQDEYRRMYLQSQANQAENLCLRMAKQAGYQARAAVYLRPSGGLEEIRLWLEVGQAGALAEAGPAAGQAETGADAGALRGGPQPGATTPLLSAEQLQEAVSQAFGARQEQVKVFMGEGG